MRSHRCSHRSAASAPQSTLYLTLGVCTARGLLSRRCILQLVVPWPSPRPSISGQTQLQPLKLGQVLARVEEHWSLEPGAHVKKAPGPRRQRPARARALRGLRPDFLAGLPRGCSSASKVKGHSQKSALQPSAACKVFPMNPWHAPGRTHPYHL